MITVSGDDYKLIFDPKDEVPFDESFFFAIMHGIFEDKHDYAKEGFIHYTGDSTDLKICNMSGSILEVSLAEPHSTTLKEFLSQRFL